VKEESGQVRRGGEKSRRKGKGGGGVSWEREILSASRSGDALFEAWRAASREEGGGEETGEGGKPRQMSKTETKLSLRSRSELKKEPVPRGNLKTERS